MYTDEDLDGAVSAGVFSEDAVKDFRVYIEGLANSKTVDEENFRLISGFNDIFVVVASLLFLVSAGILAALWSKLFGFLLVAAIAWWLSVHFVLKRRLALPAIVFLLAYVVGVFGVSFELLKYLGIEESSSIFFSCAVAGLMTRLHWQIFKVPITVAVGVSCFLAFCVAVLVGLFPESLGAHPHLIAALSGCILLLAGLYWDAQDTERKTRKSDVAFWLHLIAAPLIVHPVFSPFSRGFDVALSGIAAVIVVYLLLAVISVIIDRRALMVSALVYVIYAFTELLKSYNSSVNGLAISALCIGGFLLFLSSNWRAVRVQLLKPLPATVRQYLPR